MSMGIDCEAPARSEPSRKMTIAACNMILRPYKSEILPQIGVEAVLASRYAVTTHESWARPLSSLVIRGRAVETIV